MKASEKRKKESFKRAKVMIIIFIIWHPLCFWFDSGWCWFIDLGLIVGNLITSTEAFFEQTYPHLD